MVIQAGGGGFFNNSLMGDWGYWVPGAGGLKMLQEKCHNTYEGANNGQEIN
jgi:hypothetical protein